MGIGGGGLLVIWLVFVHHMPSPTAQGINLVVIPRWNVRAQQAKWELEKAVKVPSNMMIVFLSIY